MTLFSQSRERKVERRTIDFENNAIKRPGTFDGIIFYILKPSRFEHAITN